MAIQANFPAIKPSLMLDFANTKQLDSRITYTRASTATFYNGVTTSKAEENFIVPSVPAATGAWLPTGATKTVNNNASPDGTTTACLITAVAGTTVHNIDYGATISVTTGLPYVYSVYAKAGTESIVQVVAGNAGNFGLNIFANFDLSAGTVTLTGSSATASITSVGSGWYRLVVSGTCIGTGTTGNMLIILCGGNTTLGRNASWTAVGTETLSIWGAQVEQRSAVTAYTATTTQAITNYIPVLQTAASGVARFDNNPTTGESLGLLIEESRTNLLTYSAEFDNSAWSKNASTITANTIVAPDGTLIGDKLVEGTTADAIACSRTGLSFTSANTFSLYAKAGERRYAFFRLFASVGNYGCLTFDLQTGTITQTNSVGVVTVTGAITSVGNGWYRISAVASSSSAAITIAGVILSNTGTPTFSTAGVLATPYTGDGFSGIYIWGAQLELGAFATSYIPTVASQVTRAADAASMTGTNFTNWFNFPEGTLYADVVPNSGSITTDQILFHINDSTSSQRHKISRYASVFYGTTRIPGTTVVDMSLGTANSNTAYRVMYAYKTNDFAGTSNAGTVATDTSGTLPLTLTAASIGKNAFDAEFLNGTIKKIAYYPIKVTNTNLQALTS